MAIVQSRTGKPVNCIMGWRNDWRNAEKWIDKLKNLEPGKPWFDHATSSVEQGMAEATIREAILLVEPENPDELMVKFHEYIKNSSYTNWSGD